MVLPAESSRLLLFHILKPTGFCRQMVNALEIIENFSFLDRIFNDELVHSLLGQIPRSLLHFVFF